MIKKKETVFNIITALFHQLVTIVCGLIVPRLLIHQYGSEVNGLVSSITQFLSYITLLESGVGGVAKAAMYKPLAEGDLVSLSVKQKAVQDFFRKISFIYLGYFIVLCFVYPVIIHSSLSYEFVASLVLVIGFSTFSNYYFGLPSQLLLMADNKSYIIQLLQAVSLIFNAIFTVILVKIGLGIHAVKFGSSLIFFIRPIVLNLITRKKYEINFRVKSDKNVLSNRWYGLTQHIAYFIHSNTDVVILSLFTNVIYVSVYSVYLMVVNGIEKIINSVITSFNAVFGKLYAKNELYSLNKAFKFVEDLCYMLTTVMYSVTYTMIIPFIRVYTSNVTDAEYIYPLFATIMIVAEGFYCIRIPYSSLVLSAGFYKETSRDSFIEAALNIIISLILVHKYNLVGIAIGTAIGMGYRTITYMIFLSKHIIKHKLLVAVKKILVNLVGCGIGIIISNTFILSSMEVANSFLEWAGQAIIVALLVFVFDVILNLLFNRQFINVIINNTKQLLNNKL